MEENLAELILTEDEKEAATYLEWDDASLGKAVKKLAKGIGDHKGSDSMAQTACATFLACLVSKRDAIGAEIDLDGVTDDGKDMGDWQVIIKRKKRVKQ